MKPHTIAVEKNNKNVKMTNEKISITQMLITIVGALGLRELLPVIFSSVFRRREDIESVNTENTARLQQASREQILFLKESIREAYSEVDRMQEALNDKRALINTLSKKLYKIELEMQLLRTRIESTSCKDADCPFRQSIKKDEIDTHQNS
ncbi:MAG: hypothetical protein IKT29_00110 [Flavobacteriales bacterium]|nr:hypothetical protein [Flavobacteriales bacterium]